MTGNKPLRVQVDASRAVRDVRETMEAVTKTAEELASGFRILARGMERASEDFRKRMREIEARMEEERGPQAPEEEDQVERFSEEEVRAMAKTLKDHPAPPPGAVWVKTEDPEGCGTEMDMEEAIRVGVEGKDPLTAAEARAICETQEIPGEPVKLEPALRCPECGVPLGRGGVCYSCRDQRDIEREESER